MAQTRSGSKRGGTSSDSVATQLAAIAAKLKAMESLKEDMAMLKRQATGREKSSESRDRHDDGEPVTLSSIAGPIIKLISPTLMG